MFYYSYLENGTGCRSSAEQRNILLGIFFFFLRPQLRLNKDELIMKSNQPGYVTYSTQLCSAAPRASVAEKIDIKSYSPCSFCVDLCRKMDQVAIYIQIFSELYFRREIRAKL